MTLHEKRLLELEPWRKDLHGKEVKEVTSACAPEEGIRFMFVNEDYKAILDFRTDPENGEIIPETVFGGVLPLKEGLPFPMCSCILQDLNALPDNTDDFGSFWVIGYNPFSTVDARFINEHSDPKFWNAKKFLIDVDTLVREKFPGYGMIYRDGDPRGDKGEAFRRASRIHDKYL